MFEDDGREMSWVGSRSCKEIAIARKVERHLQFEQREPEAQTEDEHVVVVDSIVIRTAILCLKRRFKESRFITGCSGRSMMMSIRISGR